MSLLPRAIEKLTLANGDYLAIHVFVGYMRIIHNDRTNGTDSHIIIANSEAKWLWHKLQEHFNGT